MKANSRNVNAEKYWSAVTDTMMDNLILVIQVLGEEFCFGEKRINRMLEAMVEKAKYFDEAAADGVLDIRTEQARQEYSRSLHKLIKLRAKAFLPCDVYDMFYKDRMPTNSEARMKSKALERTQAISVKEAAKLQSDLQQAKAWVMSRDGSGSV